MRDEFDWIYAQRKTLRTPFTGDLKLEPFQVLAQIKHPFHQFQFKGVDISPGGLRIQTEYPFKIGDLVWITFFNKSDNQVQIKLKAKVIYFRDQYAGLKFFALTLEQLEKLDQYLKSL